MALQKKIVTISDGYVGIRELRPVDDMYLSELLGDKKEDALLVNNYVVAMGMEWIEQPHTDLKPEEYLIPHPTKPDNYIEVEDTEAKKNKDGSYPKKQILNPDRPHNYIVDRTKVVRKVFKPVDKLEDLNERLTLSSSDFFIVSVESNKLNEPNPALLGK